MGQTKEKIAASKVTVGMEIGKRPLLLLLETKIPTALTKITLVTIPLTNSDQTRVTPRAQTLTMHLAKTQTTFLNTEPREQIPSRATRLLTIATPRK